MYDLQTIKAMNDARVEQAAAERKQYVKQHFSFIVGELHSMGYVVLPKVEQQRD